MTFSEHFETNPGTDEVYTSQHVGAGNVLDPDFDTSLLGGGAPAGWGSQCGLVSIGATAGDAGWRQHVTSPGESRTGFLTTFSFLLSSSGLLDGQGITLIVTKEQGDPDIAPLAWRIYMWRTGAETYLLLIVGEDLLYRYPAVGSIAAGTVYDNVVRYDLVGDRFSWSVNGTEVIAAVLPVTCPQNIATKYIGSSGSSTGRNTVYLLDRIVFVEISIVSAVIFQASARSHTFEAEPRPSTFVARA